MTDKNMKLEVTRMYPRKREIYTTVKPTACFIRYAKVDRGEEMYYYDDEEPILIVQCESCICNTLHWGGKEERTIFSARNYIYIGDEVVFGVNGEEMKVKLDSEGSILQLCNQLELAIGLFEVESCT